MAIRRDLLTAPGRVQGSPRTATPWNGGIKDILGQYGMLSPIMRNIGLDDCDSVVRDREMIVAVLDRDIRDPLQMPVTRDLSDSRRALILECLANGTPRG